MDAKQHHHIEDEPLPGDTHLDGDGEADEYDDSYLFPDPSLKRETSDALLALIASNMDDAHDQTDGTDANSDVRIDHAQDLIEQARDILLKRGHVFTQKDRKQMWFMDWPLTPEEQAEKDRRDAIEAEARAVAWAKAEEQRKELRDIVSALIRGDELPGVEVQHLQFDIGDSTIRREYFAISGAEVLSMAERVRAITGEEPHVAYCCSAAGITFADDPAPGWGLSFYLTKQPELWALLKEWMRRPDFYVHASVWDYRPEKMGGVWATTKDLFERAPADPLIASLWSTGHPAGVVSLAQNDGGNVFELDHSAEQAVSLDPLRAAGDEPDAHRESESQTMQKPREMLAIRYESLLLGQARRKESLPQKVIAVVALLLALAGLGMSVGFRSALFLVPTSIGAIAFALISINSFFFPPKPAQCQSCLERALMPGTSPLYDDSHTRNAMKDPYSEALEWIKQNPGTGGANSLAKLLLSLWNSIDYPFSFGDCIGNLDANLAALALRMVKLYAERGETSELTRIGHEVYERFPRLAELGIAARDAMQAVRARWDREHEEEARLHPDE